MEERITPKMFLNHMLSKQGVTADDLDIGPIVIGSWDHNFIDSLAEEIGAEALPFWPRNNKWYNWKSDGRHITLVPIPVGAPSAVSMVEHLIACGAKVIIGIGFTGSLQPSINIGSIVIPDSCLREEGTSYHYIEDESKIVPSEELLQLLKQIFKQDGIKFESGRIWTTDAIFRELKSKIANYGSQGVLSVEMETSAMYAVGKFRGVDICNLLVVSDELWDDWHPQFGSKPVLNSLNIIKDSLFKNIDKLDSIINKGQQSA